MGATPSGAPSSGTALAIGGGTFALQEDAVALGDSANASGFHSTAIGGEALALGVGAQALGWQSRALGATSLAVGRVASAAAANSTAIGDGATVAALHTNSTAVGAGAATTAVNQVTLGGPATTVRLGGTAYSTAGVLVNDADGNISSNTTLVPAVATLQTNVGALQMLTSSQTAQLNTLFDLTSEQRDETRKGIAAVTAMAQPHFPSANGRTSYASNVGYYRGEVAFSAGLMHRLQGNVGISAGVSYAGGDHAALKAGVAGEF